MICDWWISISFLCFCVSRSVACDHNYDWKQQKTQLWRRLLNFRVRVFLKSAVMPSQEGNNFVFPRVFTRMAWSLQRESSGKRHGKRQRQGKNHFVIYYSNKDNSNFPNLPQRDKQINHNINISFNFIDYMVLFVFVSLDQHFSAEGLLRIVDSISMGQTKLPLIPLLILWTCTQNFCQFCDH